tara:strand:- start:3220 stop:3345 length:126 start_codon:yes stop_codon:yes gene_type:complete
MEVKKSLNKPQKSEQYQMFTKVNGIGITVKKDLPNHQRVDS